MEPRITGDEYYDPVNPPYTPDPTPPASVGYLVFNDNGGTGGPGWTGLGGYNSFMMECSAQIPKTIPTRKYFNFTGWKDSKTGTIYQPNQTYYASGYPQYIQNIVFYAQWTPIEYTLTYNGNGGKLSNGDTTITETVNITNYTKDSHGFTKEGYVFLGWNTSMVAEYPLYELDISVSPWFAIWEPAVYSISYMDIKNLPYSGSNQDELPIQFTYTEKIELPEGKKEMYNFKGWYLNPEGSGEPITEIAANTYPNNLILYALFEPKSNSYVYSTINGESKYRLAIPYIYIEGKGWQKVITRNFKEGWK